ncbi:MAG TPA: class I SAM-dependent methyltransferase [Usitatibacter sp.]|nr:class I SAM-dependent methyltransferase [Usitatibacter sp.]
MTLDQSTADAFASSWNNLPTGSVYSPEQAADWFAPLTAADVEGRRVLELGCGNGSLLVHMMRWKPAYLEGVDLGDSVTSATRNMKQAAESGWAVRKADLTTYVADEPFDIVYSIGVLHHLKDPKAGFDSVLRNTKPGGRFHCWVYAHEGNAVVRWFVDPIRRLACHFPWWVTKYLVATTLVVPYFFYAKIVRAIFASPGFRFLPLHDYSLWIAQREFGFFRHVAFDQLVTPQTAYLRRSTIDRWLSTHPDVEHASTYVVFRNGNSWKFGGKKAA